MAGNKADALFSRVPHDVAGRRGLAGLPGPANPAIAATAMQSRQVYPWWMEKIASAQDFNVQDFAMALPAGIGSTVTSDALRFRTPASFIAVVQIFGLYLLSPTATTRVQFQLRVNQLPVAGYDNKQFPPGAANFVLQNFSDIRVRVPNGGVVDVLITNLDGAAITVGANIAGWYNSTADAMRVSGMDY